MKHLDENKLLKMAEFIKNYINDHNGISPSLNTIIKHMGMNYSVGYRYLLALRDRGIIYYNGRGTLRINSPEQSIASFRRTPIIGIVTCGKPEDNREDVLGYLAIPEDWIEGDCFILQASGDSMIDIGISPGDLVLIKRTEVAYDGQVVAVLTEDGTTLKRYKENTSGVPWLLAENKEYPKNMRELHPSRICIIGQAKKVIKDIK